MLILTWFAFASTADELGEHPIVHHLHTEDERIQANEAPRGWGIRVQVLLTVIGKKIEEAFFSYSLRTTVTKIYFSGKIRI